MVNSFFTTDGIVTNFLTSLGLPRKDYHVESAAFPWVYNDGALREMAEEQKLFEMWTFLEECIDLIEETYYNNEENRSIGEQIVMYVQENYTNSGISQQIIADVFKISRPVCKAQEACRNEA